ncbi:conserved hypothetical protein [Vibrio vulnificus YJ016]|uniref:Uncharacterized protein n=2 Tax=Vibrio vulnificus TaxID=672 RepID=Q7ME41_VIBVY|nr:hypothetical protein [Vibrio vulnificus]KLI66525.1 hypothetical protein VVYB158_13060 [Vibrio vulnificus CladeA-yb158]MBN8120500.1 hypothetical protein [Vibrio vulnificus]BAC96869.1 conserved hypothetical protein [Vibrio vulnificus YJ016]HAS6407688.1 hypothetical protein [Vibrio vulnificus]HAS6412510.1 hypothetical protein [Vibrio vulnificus]
MSKVSIVYIGPKPKKKDTVTGSRLVFPRHIPVLVDEDIAYQLLDFPSVWITQGELDNHLKIVDEREQAEARKRQAKEEAERAEQLEASMVVTLNSEEIDLAKLNSAKLKTLIAANELDIAPKSAQEDVDTFRLRVRDHIRGLEAQGEEA